MVLAQPTPSASVTPSPTPVEEDEPEAGAPAGLSDARKAIREGKLEDGLAKLKALREAGDGRPAVHYWTGVAYQKLGLLDLAWRELHQAASFQPANRTYSNAMRSVERELVSPPATPATAPTPSATLPALLPAEDPAGLRLRAERALRAGSSRLAAGLVQRLHETAPAAPEILLLGVDAALRDGAVVLARRLFDLHPQAKAAELDAPRKRLEALEKELKPAVLEGSALERARAALDQLLLPEAMELLRESRVQSPQDPQVLMLFASLHALRGEAQVARAFVDEASLAEPGLRRFLARPELLEASPLRSAHPTLLDAAPSPAASPAPTVAP